MKPAALAFAALALLPAVCAPGALAQPTGEAVQAGSPPRPFLAKCLVVGLPYRAWCGSYEVFENRVTREGRRIALKMVVLPSLANLRAQCDLVFLDQRGTGESNPLTCDHYTDDTDLRNYFEDMFPAKEVRACRERLDKTADLKQYTTTIAIADLDEIRSALGYEKINLYGGSYGTTAALAYLRQYGSHVRTVVVAGVAPTGFELPLPFAKGAQFALDHLFDDCAADTACRAAFPDLRKEFRSVLDGLAKEPAVIELLNPLTKKPRRVTLGRGPGGATAGARHLSVGCARHVLRAPFLPSAGAAAALRHHPARRAGGAGPA